MNSKVSSTAASSPSVSQQPGQAGWRSKLTVGIVVVLALIGVLLPWYASVAGDSYSITLVSRILVYALAAVGLNLALGFGGMVSMGHAMYLGLGAYTVLLTADAGVSNGWLQLLVLVAVVSVIAAMVGWISLRTEGIAFIMITLAFAQLFYFLFVSLKTYGGDEGMSLPQVSDFGVLSSTPTGLYYFLLAALGLICCGTYRLRNSRFGLLLRATRINERRVKAVGSPPLPYRLTAYVLSALICALAGFFLANLTGFVSPAYLAWTVSGELIAMVVLGGVGTVLGPVLGAVSLLLVEEVLKAITERWLLILGPLILIMVLVLRNGIAGLLAGKNDSDDGQGGAA